MAELKYQLPCAYCADGVTFGNSEQLKSHLIKSHSSLISGGTKSQKIKEDHAVLNKKEKLSRIPTSEVYKSSSEVNAVHSPLGKSYQSSFVAANSPVRSEIEIKDFTQKKITRLNDVIKQKCKEIEKHQNEIDLLKTDLTIKDEEHHQIKQIWRKEAEDAIRKLKINYEDVLTQNRMFEKQLIESEREKNTLRISNDQIAKDQLDIQTKIAAEKLIFQKEKQLQLNASSKDEETRELTKMLSTELQTVRRKNENLAIELTTKDNKLNNVNEVLKSVEDKLTQERKSCRSVSKENLSLKGKIAELEANNIQADHNLNGHKGSLTILSKKYQNMECSYKVLTANFESLQLCNNQLCKEVAVLKEEKTKLVNNLNIADKALSKLGHRISAPVCCESNSNNSSTKMLAPSLSLRSYISEDVKTTLEEVVAALKQIPLKENNNSKEELSRLNSELQKSNLMLMEEKALVIELKHSLIEMEDCVKDSETLSQLEKKKSKDLQNLRRKHQICIKTAKMKRQLSREKKNLQRKLTELQKQNEILSFMHESLKSEYRVKESFIKNLTADYEKSLQDNSILNQNTIDLKKQITDKEIMLEKYKRESCFLLENLNKASEENEQFRQRYEKLEKRLDDCSKISDMKNNLDDVQRSIAKIETGFDERILKESSCFETYVKQNEHLSSKVLTLQSKLCDSENRNKGYEIKLKSLQNELNTKEDPLNSLLENEKESDILHRSLEKDEFVKKIENLTLQRDILSSRVLVLEAIREETEILRKDKEILKEEILKLKLQNKSVKLNKNPSSDKPSSKETGVVLFTNESEFNQLDDFMESTKHLDDLDEDDKIKLKEMLSTPIFESFLSEDDIQIDLTENHSSHSCLSHNSQEHVIEYLYEEESDTRLFENASNEFITHLYSTDPDEECETTLDYNTRDYKENQSKLIPNDDAKQLAEKSLDKIFKESKLINEDISRQQKNIKVDYSHVLQEFQKVILEMSGSESNTSLISETRPLNKFLKQVKFSDQVIELFDPSSKTIQQSQHSDSKFFRSFIQDALKYNYPTLAAQSTDDMAVEKSPPKADRTDSFSIKPIEELKTNTTILAAPNTAKLHPTDSKEMSNSSQYIQTNNEEIQADVTASSVSNKSVSNYEETQSWLKGKTSTSTITSNSNALDAHFVSDAFNTLKSFIDKANKSKENLSSQKISSNYSTCENSVKNLINGEDIFTKLQHEQSANINYIPVPSINNSIKIVVDQYDKDITPNTSLDSFTENIKNIETVENPGTYLSQSECVENIVEYNRNNMSFEDFGGTLFSNPTSSNLDAEKNLTVPGMYNSLNVPSSMHRPANLDFSDASLTDISLFK